MPQKDLLIVRPTPITTGRACAVVITNLHTSSVLYPGVTVICVSLGYVFPRTHFTRDMCSPEGIYVPPVAVICVPQGYVFPRLQGQVQGRHLHPRGETVHHGAVPDLALSPRGRVSPTYVALALYGDEPAPCMLACLSATRIHDPRAETTNYGAETTN